MSTTFPTKIENVWSDFTYSGIRAVYKKIWFMNWYTAFFVIPLVCSIPEGMRNKWKWLFLTGMWMVFDIWCTYSNLFFAMMWVHFNRNSLWLLLWICVNLLIQSRAKVQVSHDIQSQMTWSCLPSHIFLENLVLLWLQFLLLAAIIQSTPFKLSYWTKQDVKHLLVWCSNLWLVLVSKICMHVLRHTADASHHACLD